MSDRLPAALREALDAYWVAYTDIPLREFSMTRRVRIRADRARAMARSIGEPESSSHVPGSHGPIAHRSAAAIAALEQNREGEA